VIVRRERPHPGAQLCFTDLDGLRLTCFATNAKGSQLAHRVMPKLSGTGGRCGTQAVWERTELPPT
jgi:hypothetical protein